MDPGQLRRLLDDVAAGLVHPDDALVELRHLPYRDLGFARVDHHRVLRQGMPEVVYGPGKSVEHCVAIVAELLASGASPVILSRADPAQIAAVTGAHVGGTVIGATVVWRPVPSRREQVVVAAAGTADLYVAEECIAVLRAHGVEPTAITDVGVAGLHRLLDEVPTITAADVVVVVAGMEGALATAVGGLTAAPVVAVPTSVGYGAALEGVTALLAMLSSCASGVTVVGIDNGFGAACAALRLCNTMDRRAELGAPVVP